MSVADAVSVIQWPDTFEVRSLLSQVCAPDKRGDPNGSRDHSLKLLLADACQDAGALESFCTAVRLCAEVPYHPYCSSWGRRDENWLKEGWAWWGNKSYTNLVGPIRNAIIPREVWDVMVLQDYFEGRYNLVRAYKTCEAAYLQLCRGFSLLAEMKTDSAIDNSG